MKKNYSELFEKMHAAGKLAAKTLDELTPFVKPGVTTNFLDKICYEYIKDNGGYSAPLFYKGFPKSSCTSTNHVICHGIPAKKYLRILGTTFFGIIVPVLFEVCLTITKNNLPKYFICD